MKKGIQNVMSWQNTLNVLSLTKGIIMGKFFSVCRKEEDNGSIDNKNFTAHEQSNVQNFIHTDAVTCLSKKNSAPEKIFSGSKDQHFAIFDVESGRVEQKVFAHGREITKISFNSKQDTLVTTSRDKLIKIWSLGERCHEIGQMSGHTLVITGLDVSPDGNQIISGSRDNTVRLWDINSCACLRQATISSNLVSHLKWACDSHLIVQSGEDKELRIWDARTLSVAVTFPRKNYIQSQCDISLDSNYCLSCSNGFGGAGCEATLWDVRKRDIIHELIGHREAIGSCAFIQGFGGPDELLATGSADSTVRLWSRVSGAEVSRFELAGCGPVAALQSASQCRLYVATFLLGVQALLYDPKNEDLQRVMAY